MKDNHKQMPPPLHIVYNSMDDQELGEGTIRLPPGGRLCFNQADVNQDQNYSSVVLDRRLGCLCPWPGVGRADVAQHSLDHQRRQRSGTGLLRRRLRNHATHRRSGRKEQPISSLLVERSRLCSSPNNDHHWSLPAGDRSRAHAE